MIKEFIDQLEKKEDLDFHSMQSAIEFIMTGEVDDLSIEKFLLALNEKGISEKEITAAAIVMKDKSLTFNIGNGDHIDTCGTGGSGLNTFNCSTASSFVAAAGGALVAKHGNKAVSSKSGSADLLIAAGADITHDREKIETIFDRVGFVFLFAPLHHQSMKYVMPARQKIGKKTLFNLLGPHTNPCGAKKQILGVYDKELVKSFAAVAKNLSMEHVLIVHGFDGLDEITLSQNTYVCELKNKKITNYYFDPRDIGYDYIALDDIKGGDPKYNAECFMKMINGDYNQFQKIVEINAGAAIYLSGKANNIKEGALIAEKSIYEGKTKEFISSITNE